MTELPKAYWFGQVSSGAYSEVPVLCMERSVAAFSAERMEAVWQRLIRRHDMLRAIVRSDGMFEIVEPPPFAIATTDLRQVAPALVEDEVARVHDAVLSRQRPLDSWPLFDVHAVRLPDGTTRMLYAFCTVIFDAFSWFLLERDADALYLDPGAELPPLGKSYAQYVAASAAAEHGPERERATAYWADRLSSLPRGPSLPVPSAPHGERPERVRRWHHSEFRLRPDQAAGLKQTARALGLSKYSLATAVFAEAIATWSKSRHFVLTLLVQARPGEYASVLGNFGSTIALEVDFRGPRSFRQRARELHRRFLSDLEHRAASGIYVSREINRLSGRPPSASFPVAFSSFWNGSDDRASDKASCLGSYVRRRLRVPDVSLDVGMVEHPDGSVICRLDARADLFRDGFLDDLEETFRRLLVELARGGDVAERIRPVGAPERDLALVGRINRTEAPLDDRLLHELFLEQAARRPADIAVISPERTLSYGELERRSAALAHRLRALGVGPGQLVAVPMVRGWQQAVAVLAIHRAGAAYVPIDLALVPHERILHIFRHAEVRIAITQPDAAGAIDWPADTTILTVEDAGEAPAGAGVAPEQAWPRQRPDDIAYVIYTSGSTGLPKGVTIDHRGAVNTVLDINRRFAVGERDRVLALSSLGFDLSVWDLFGTFAAGGVLVMPPASERVDPAEWARAGREHGVTIWNSVPKLLEMTIENIGERRELWPDTVRLAMLSGDWIPLSLPDRARALAGALEVVSLGGATEASIWSIYFPIGAIDPGWASIPYGRPLTNQTFHVLDDALAQRPVWVTGELCIGGVGLAKGYWRDDDKTRASFVAHPETGERLYRTGDLGRYLPDGNIEFLGREDSQIKVRGYRVELGEIKSVIAKLPGVRDAFVLARDAAAQRAHERRHTPDSPPAQPSDRSADKQLVAYVVAEPGGAPGGAIDLGELRSQVAEKLPEYMVPTFFVALSPSQVPRSSNGKVNLRDLPPPEEVLDTHHGATHRAPSDALELSLHALFASVLGIDELGVDDSFFELGGDSVTLVRVLSRIRKEHGREISVASFALDPRVSSIARLLREPPERAAERAAERALVVLRREGPRTPLFLIHPVGGSGLAYLGLARHVAQVRPIYALQSRGLETDEPPRTTIEDMAAAYVAEIQAVQPRGPYLLGGWSLGGTVAFEVAGQLYERGELARVLMIDTWAPQGSAAAPAAEAVLLAWFRRDAAQVSDLVPGTRDHAAEAHRSGALPPAMARRFAVYCANSRALRAYVPRARPVRVALIRAASVPASFADHPALRDPLLDDRALGWAPLTSLPIELRSAAGDHYTMFAADHIASLATRVDEIVAMFEGEGREISHDDPRRPFAR
ncbi:MAG TPA: amino acid adenylation domain-containing protein [Kofleriaceae bacterium]|nr:amino acid adenylation domain-containing protein [Kofleriaceae bacterium]